MLSPDKSDLLNDESGDYGSDSWSAGTCTFSFCFEEPAGRVDDSISRVHDMGSGVFVPTRIESIGDFVPLVVLIPIGIESKGGQLIELFWHPKS